MMVVGTDELERLADDMYKDRVIASSVYCGHCGYNLRTLPYVYTCPECGNQYNARPLKMSGIFNPHTAEFPLRDIVVTVVCALITVVLGDSAIRPVNYWLGVAIFFAIFAVLSGREAYVRMRRYVNAVSIIRRIAAEEEEFER